MNNIQIITLLLTFSCLCFALISCNNTNQTYSLNTNDFVKTNLNISSQNSLQNINQSESADMNEARFENYNYNYKKEGEKTVAMFPEKFLPRDDKVVVGAIRDVIKRAYNDNVTSSPSLKNRGGVNKIFIESKKSDYYVTLVKEDTGEVHSLIIERELK